MSAFSFTEVYDDKTNRVNIRHAVASKGDCHSGRVGLNKPIGVQIVANGAVKIFNSNAEYWADISKGNRIEDPVNWSTHRAKGKYATFIATENNTEWYCILDPELQVQWDGKVHTIDAGNSTDLTDMTGKRIFLATAGANVNGIDLEQHQVCHFHNTNTATVVAPVDQELIFVVFYDPAVN